MIGVIGATGNVGSALVRELVGAGERVIAIAPSGGTDGPLLAYVKADVTRPDSLVKALEGATAVFVLAPVEAHHDLDADAVVRAVAGSGAKRAVLLSSMGVISRPHATGYDSLRALEAAGQRSGLAVTILRPTGFASNTLGWIHGIRATGAIMAPFADTPIPVVDPADIAAVAAVALRTPDHAGKVYDLTGPAPITPREQAAAIASALGKSLAFTEVTRAQAAAAMRAFIPEDLVEATLDISGSPNEIERRVSPDIERVLGRPATSYAAWAQRNVDAFR